MQRQKIKGIETKPLLFKREGLEKLYCFLPEQLERREDTLGGHLESGRLIEEKQVQVN